MEWNHLNCILFFQYKGFFLPVTLTLKTGGFDVVLFMSVMTIPLTYVYYHLIHPLWYMKYLHALTSFYCFTQNILRSRPPIFPLRVDTAIQNH